MNTILTTRYFDEWLSDLRDNVARLQIARRIERAESGNFGDHKHITDSILEMRVHYGPGYRVYYAQKENTIFVLLCAGDKSSQQKDVNLAIEIWEKCNGQGYAETIQI